MFKKFFKKIFAGTRMTVKTSVPFKTQEIWWSTLEGRELPVVVFRKFGNDMFWALPLTAKTAGNNQPSYFAISLSGKKHTALSRMRTLSSNQLVRKMGKISTRQFGALNTSVIQLLSETDPVKKVVRVSRTPSSAPKYVVKSVTASIRHSRPVPVFPSYAFRT